MHRRLTGGLSAEQRKRLDALTEHREGSSLSWLAWLQQMPEAAKPSAMLGLIERLEHVRAIGIEPGRGHLVHQARLAQLAREAGRTTVQHVAGYERQRRHATLAATTLDNAASLTDQAVDLFDRLVGAMFRKADGRHARAFRADARAINEKVRLYARIGAALIAAHDDKQDAYGAIATVIPWERFRATVAEAEALARPEGFDALENLGEYYVGIRRWSPAFLDAFDFEGVPACISLMRAIMVLREANRSGAGLPKSAPTGFVWQRWVPYVLPGGTIDRRHYELCVLSEPRDRLRAGDVWVSGSRQYRSFEERLISAETLQELQQSGALPIAVEPDFEQFTAGRQALLDERLKAVDAQATAGRLPDVTVTNGVLKIAPIEKATPPEAEALAARLYAMLPRIRITDLLAEVAGWTGFPNCFTHLRTGEVAADNRILMAGLLADGLNLGLTRVAERAASPASASSPGHRTGTSAKRPTPWRCAAWSTTSSGSPSRRTSAAAPPRHRTASSSRLPARPGCSAAKCPLQPAIRLQGLLPPLRPLRAVLHQADRGDGERGAACAGRAALSSERGDDATAPHRWRRRFRPCVRTVQPARFPVRAAHPGSQASPALQLR